MKKPIMCDIEVNESRSGFVIPGRGIPIYSHTAEAPKAGEAIPNYILRKLKIPPSARMISIVMHFMREKK